MQERQRTRTRQIGPAPSSGLCDDGWNADPAGMSTVIHSTFAERLPVSGMRVSQVRSRFRDRLDIHPEAHALLDGHPVDEDAMVQTDQVLMFVRPAGERGLGSEWNC